MLCDEVSTESGSDRVSIQGAAPDFPDVTRSLSLPVLTPSSRSSSLLQKIRSIAFRLFGGSFATPTRNLGMITSQQNVGGAQAFKVWRPRVLWTIQQPV